MLAFHDCSDHISANDSSPKTGFKVLLNLQIIKKSHWDEIWICAGCGMSRGCKHIDEDLHRVAPFGVQKSPEITNSFLQRPEGVLHVLQQLGKVSSDLSFTILHRVLNHKSNARQSRQSPHFAGSTRGKGGRSHTLNFMELIL